MIVPIAWRNIWRNRRRSVLSMLSIFCSTMVIVLLFALIVGMQGDLETIVTTYISGDLQVLDAEYHQYRKINSFEYWIEAEVLERIMTAAENQEDIVGISPRVSHFGTIYEQGELQQNIELIGIDPALNVDFQDLSGILVAGSVLDVETVRNTRAAGRLQPVVIGSLLAQQAELELGSRFTVITSTVNYATNAMSFTVVGIVEFPLSHIDGVTVYAPRDAIASLVQFPGGVTEVYLRAAEGANLDVLAEGLQQVIDREDLKVEPWTDSNTTYNMLALAWISYTIMAFIFFLLGSVAIVNTTIMTIYERKREIGLLMALGMHGRSIRTLFFLESFFIAVIAAIVGALCGSGIVGLLSIYGIDMTAQMQGVTMDIRSIIYPRFHIWLTLLVLVYSVVVASIASFIPTRRVRRTEPADILRDET